MITQAMFCFRLSQRNCLLLILSGIFLLLSLFLKWPFLFEKSMNYERCATYSPAYPSAGGGGCSPLCNETDGVKNSSYAAVFYRKNNKWPEELVTNMKTAASILKQFGQPRTLDTERGLHLTFDYYCCYTEEEAAKIGQFLNGYSWKPHEVWFDKIECAIHGYNDAVSLVLMVDRNSQEDLTQWALKNERDLEVKTGVHKRIPHTRLQNFHMTLGTLNQSNFPVQSAVEEINRVIPPGKWHKTPVILRRPVCKKCQKAIDAVSNKN